MSNDLCDKCKKNHSIYPVMVMTGRIVGMNKVPEFLIEKICQKCHDNGLIKKDPMPNKLTPCEIEVLMYLCRNCPRNIGGLSSEIVSATRNLIYRKLIEEDGIDYLLTEGGNLLVEALCLTPLPVQKWVMPDKE